jgi:hypothetical protein
MAITGPQIEHWFAYHAPDERARDKYQAIRDAAKKFAEVVVANTPESADQTVAVRCIRDAVFNANAAIALKGR